MTIVKIRGKEAYPFYFGASPETLRIAGELRACTTKTEKVLWKYLRNKQCYNQKFRRQHPIGKFIVDFFCYEAMLVIELDGKVHDDEYQAEIDHERTNILNDLGIHVIRFKNESIFKDIKGVLNSIEKTLSQRIIR